ncbi:hypothetical protein C8K30_1026 [Promicromonospora sp. AC04]|uniref:hypothetical protein n=1 Tax=Promicromonospora sp. AC04 TaxID=2135723 RepID=UPI000D3644F9|nr:hypothetical protein [Promicromonospora sp. AC04]PUB29632.1 hypothetical protein C8K30_1026 [Promicromonospora sp. AC04]
MMHDGVTPPAEPADPLWYLILDLLGTWIGALGSAAAAIAAVWLGLHAIRSQQAQERRQARAQAELVIVARHWDPDSERINVQVRNDSTRAITRIQVVTEDATYDETGGSWARHGLLEPASTAGFEFHSTTADADGLAAVEFDDATNQSWVRTSDGQLSNVDRRHLEYVLRPLTQDAFTVSDIMVSRHPGSSSYTLMPRHSRRQYRTERSRMFREKLQKIVDEQAREQPSDPLI